MYYYIAEPVSTTAEQKRLDEIRVILDQLGISGEFSIASSKQNIQDNLDLALSKHFTTVVGIGGDSLANTIATTILHYDSERTAMGMIATQPSVIGKMIGGSSLKDFCQILRARLLVPIDTVTLNPRCAFITSANITTEHPTAFQLEYDQIRLVGEFTNLTVAIDGAVRLWHAQASPDVKQAKSGFMNRFFKPATTDNLSLTQFNADSWSLETETPCSVEVAGETVTETPIYVNRRPKTLKLIVNRARISPDNTLIQ